jgi:hypothetical protein
MDDLDSVRVLTRWVVAHGIALKPQATCHPRRACQPGGSAIAYAPLVIAKQNEAKGIKKAELATAMDRLLGVQQTCD